MRENCGRNNIFPRPGGTIITEKAMLHCCFGQNAKLADIGCGSGESVRFIKKTFGYEVTGIDKNIEIIEGGENKSLLCGDALSLPFRDGELDGILYECSFSKMDEPEKVLSEAHRVLKKEGWIIISDFYALETETVFSGILGRVEKKGSFFSKLQSAGFVLDVFEDHTDRMRILWGQLIFDYGEEHLCSILNTDKKTLSTVKCGYGLFIARKARK